MPKIQLKTISKTFENGFEALNQIDLEIQDREFMVIVGPSGCGKTTLLRILSGLEDPSNGSIYFDEKKINQVAPKDRGVGMVFQNYALFPHLSAFENMAFSLKAKNTSEPEIKRIVNSVAAELELENMLDRKPHQLSGGQKQRVALGRLLAKDPEIRLFDEPLSNLDAHLRNSMRRDLKKLHGKNPKTTLFVTHDQEEAMTLGQRICVIKNGSVEQIGSPSEIYHFPSNKFVAQFFGAPSINLIEGKIISRENHSFTFETEFFDLLVEGVTPPVHDQDAILGVRAENFEISTEVPTDSRTAIEVTNQDSDDLGKEKIIHSEVGGIKIAVKIDAGMEIPKERFWVCPNWKKINWFDPRNGLRI